MPAQDTPTVASRRRKLREWIKDHHKGSRKNFLEAVHARGFVLDPTEVSNLQSGKKSFGEKKAAEYEEAIGMPAGYLVCPLPSHSAGLDLSILGTALTSMDKVVRGRMLRVEGHLGTFAPVLAAAYQMAVEEFPNGIPDSSTKEGKKALVDFDMRLDEYLGGGIADGTLGPFEKIDGTGQAGTRSRQAETKKATVGRG